MVKVGIGGLFCTLSKVCLISQQCSLGAWSIQLACPSCLGADLPFDPPRGGPWSEPNSQVPYNQIRVDLIG